MTRSASCIICEDVRIEANGKATFIGTYGTNLLTNSFPLELPQLVFAITVRSSIDNPHRKMAIIIELPGVDDRVFDSPAFPEMLLESVKSPTALYVETRRSVTLKPFKAVESGRLRVWVETEAEKIFAGSLNLQLHSESANVLNISAIVRAISFYHAVKEKNDPREGSLATYMLDFLTELVPEAVLRQGKSSEPQLIDLGSNIVKGFFPTPQKTAPSIEFICSPDTLDAKILKTDEFGFLVEFHPKNIPFEEATVILTVKE